MWSFDWNLDTEKKRSYTPEELGFLGFPGLREIYFFECGAKDHHKTLLGGGLFNKILAHAHQCLDDPIRGAICVMRPKYLVIRNNFILWHEYAHILDKTFAVNCDTKANLEKKGYALSSLSHGKGFTDIMVRWGLDPSSGIGLNQDEL